MAERILLMLGLAVPLMTGCATSAPGGAGASSSPSSPVESSAAAGPGDGPSAIPDPVPLPPQAGGCEARVGPDRLRRSSVKRTVDAGLGRWLQAVSIDPLLARGHFQGWIIRALPANDGCYTGVDLRAGDVVTRVNGKSIERPEEALEVWVALPTSRELVVDFLREGQARSLRLGIVDQ